MDAEKEPTGVTRGQNAVLVAPMDWTRADEALVNMADRVDTAQPGTQLLVITADAENAVAAARAFVHHIGDQPVSVIAATPGSRAARLLKVAPSHIVTGTPADLVGLQRASALKLDDLRGIVFAWLDPILDTAEAAPLEALLGEAPKDAARLILAADLSPTYEGLIERYARRARRAPVVAETEAPTKFDAEYVAVTPQTRASLLRRLLDALDLPAAELYVRAENTRAESRAIARSLGYLDADVRVISEPSATSNDPIVLVDLPASRAEFVALVGAGARKIYALVGGSQLSAFRAMLGGGSAAPVTLIEAAERARGRDTSMRASIREILVSGDVRREVLALEPLLSEFDGIEIAAAALRLFEQQMPTRPAGPGVEKISAGPMQRLFVNLGEKDGVRKQELVTLVTTEAGIPGSQIGQVEVRDNHSIVEVAASVAELVVGKLSGAAVRGRRVQARVDQPRDAAPPARDDRPPRGDKPARSFDRGDRGDRPSRPRSFDKGDRPARSFDKGDRPARSFDRGDRPARPAFDRGDRPARPAFNRGDRPARPAFDRGDRPARPAFDKGDRPARPAFDRGDRPARPSFDKGDRGSRPAGGSRSTGPRRFTRDDGKPPRPRRDDR